MAWLVSSLHAVPRWVEVLLSEKFFNACIIHQHSKKKEKNILCLDCCTTICPHCVSPRSSHRLLQIRRYVYHDVIRLDDARQLIDCSDVQSYTSNGAKVIFIHQRPQTRQFRGSSNFCTSCDRCLQDSYFFCSFYCKINYLTKTQKGDFSKFLFDCKFLPLPSLDDGLITHDSVLEPTDSSKTWSGSSGSGEVMGCSSRITDIVRKKKSSLSACRPEFSPGSEISANMNRRKKTPQRAPLH